MRREEERSQSNTSENLGSRAKPDAATVVRGGEADTVGSDEGGNRRSKTGRRVALIALLVSIGWVLYWQSDRFSLNGLAAREEELLAYRDAHPLLVIAMAFVVYVGVTGLSIPGATGLSLAIGWYLGFWRGFVLVSFASTLGATIAFLLSRFLLRDMVQHRYAERVQAFNRAIERDGVLHLITLRLVPVVPFFVVNVVMGLTPLRTTTFWWASQLGMLPGTAAYLFAGSSFGSLRDVAERGAAGIITPRLLFAFAVLAMLPLGAKYAGRQLKARRNSRNHSHQDGSTSSEKSNDENNKKRIRK